MRLAVGKPLPPHVVRLRSVVIDCCLFSQILVSALIPGRIFFVDSLSRVVYNINLVSHEHLLLFDVVGAASGVIRVMLVCLLTSVHRI